ncbi:MULTISPECIES: response regulator transcription factor [unclassified Lysinibacillus]|uniref:response regulator transcription factor n=1 Tax=unclassified Lysinibacillus TaxID=2636778 RepID=UPI00201287C8|nr:MULTISPECIES: response regulator transcription factor [unclassified Lysinibacillus]MCL1694868.1 response regulator transcription factor [Lysinibacillus sp. BPa_S21]MCL1701461.1 response regulator transcription factor [Lysinibacillus sp. Bpr_S20]
MGKKKILIIEDEYDLASMIKKYLLLEQYDVELSLNGGKALTAFDMFKPDMILLDIMLPEKDGLEILRQVRMKSTLPVIIISAKETELDRILGLKIGADDYMIKPFSMKELVARIEAIFRRIDNYSRSTIDKQILKYNQFRIDVNSREISHNNSQLNFTAKEFDLFVFLLQHPKQVFSKTQIYDNVWGINEYGDMNTVTIHVQKIREKLGQGHEITTIRGIGYRFDGVLL